MVQVTAQTLYEAVAQALRIFREDEWSEDPDRSPASVVVTINHPQVEHRVRIKDFENWLESAGKSPAEMALKNRLRTSSDALAAASKAAGAIRGARRADALAESALRKWERK
jgi:hypothetical protein